MRLLSVAILLVAAMNTAAFADTITIDFNGLADNPSNDMPFNSYAESGFTVSPTSGSWVVVTSYGDPAPSVQFMSTGISMASVAVTDGGSGFSFSSVDLYSSVTPIPYTFTGLDNQTEVFTVSGTVPNTFGAFVEVPNPDPMAIINTLDITLSNPIVINFPNPVGFDNIVLAPASAIPEPASWILLGAGLALVVAAHKTKGKSSRDWTKRLRWRRCESDLKL
jgi:hypothetical protein